MRSLSFGTAEVDRDRFDILYGGACVSPRGVARTELNTFNGLMKKLEEVGKPIEGVSEQAQCKFELSDEGGQVLLEEQEYRLLNEMHDMVKWTKNFAGKAEEAYKWFASISKTTLKKVEGKVTEEPEVADSGS
jgi:hypothetical protein